MNTDRRSITIPLSIFGRALKLLWEELFLLGLAGYAWILIGIFILPLAPITVGLFYVTNQVAHGNAIAFKTQFVGARQFLSRGLIWGAINLIAGLLIWSDLRYYQQLESNVGIAFVILAILLTLTWIVIQLLVLPFLIEIGPAHLQAALKRALVLVVSQPLFVVSLLIVMTLLVLACWYLPVLIGYALVYLALIANLAVVTVTERRPNATQSSKKPDHTPH